MVRRPARAVWGALANGTKSRAPFCWGRTSPISDRLIAPKEATCRRALQGDDREVTREDIVYSNLFRRYTATPQASIVAAGNDPDMRYGIGASKMSFGTDAFRRERQGESLERQSGAFGQGHRQRRQGRAGAAEMIASLKKEYDEAFDPRCNGRACRPLLKRFGSRGSHGRGVDLIIRKSASSRQ